MTASFGVASVPDSAADRDEPDRGRRRRALSREAGRQEPRGTRPGGSCLSRPPGLDKVPRDGHTRRCHPGASRAEAQARSARGGGPAPGGRGARSRPARGGAAARGWRNAAEPGTTVGLDGERASSGGGSVRRGWTTATAEPPQRRPSPAAGGARAEPRDRRTRPRPRGGGRRPPRPPLAGVASGGAARGGPRRAGAASGRAARRAARGGATSEPTPESRRRAARSSRRRAARARRAARVEPAEPSPTSRSSEPDSASPSAEPIRTSRSATRAARLPGARARRAPRGRAHERRSPTSPPISSRGRGARRPRGHARLPAGDAGARPALVRAEAAARLRLRLGCRERVAAGSRPPRRPPAWCNSAASRAASSTEPSMPSYPISRHSRDPIWIAISARSTGVSGTGRRY